MYKNVHAYTPFSHDNIDVKNNLIDFARKQDKKTAEGAFSAVLIYANVVDYLARHLLENLLKMISIQSFNKFGGVLFLDGETKRTSVPLGELCRELKNFEFPGKKDFLECLSEFNKLRKSLLHKLMELEPNGSLQQLDANLVRVADIAEDLITKYGVISSGITNAWNLALETKSPHTDQKGEEKSKPEISEEKKR